jgi:uncharacterized Fe-S cluster protein YjdI
MKNSSKKKFQYPGEHVDVDWDANLCIHIGECGRSEGILFQVGRKPWCDPNLSSDEHVAEVVERCPTGALSYNFKDGKHREKAPSENKVTVSYNGPYFVTGDLAIDEIGDDMPGVAFRATLCRCDGAHVDADFKSD